MNMSRRVPQLLSITLSLCASACLGSEADRENVNGYPTLQEYAASLPRDDTGAYIVEGDIPVWEIDELEDYYAASIFGGAALTLDQSDANVDYKYTATEALSLTYCVSNLFTVADKATVVNAFAAAAAEWTEATKIASADTPTIRFTYMPLQDQNCTSSNTNVFFNIRPHANNPDFEVRSFGPVWKGTANRHRREVLVTPTSLVPWRATTFVGSMRHEIGHILGFRHEHVRVLGCPVEDASWRALTPYDVPSVMHYRDATNANCVNQGTTEYVLTTHDSAGVRCLYTTQSRAAADTAADACRALTSLSVAGSSFAVDRSDRIYRLIRTASGSDITSTIARYVPPTTTAGQNWTNIWSATTTSAASTTAVLAGGAQLFRRTSGSLYRWTGAAWTTISGGTGSGVVIDYISGDLFRVNTNGTIDHLPAGQSVPVNILSTTAVGRKIFAGTTDLLRVDANGDAYRWTTTSGWSARIGTGIRALAKTLAGEIYCLLNDAAGTMMVLNSAGSWVNIGSGASAIWGGLERPYSSMIDNTATAADESKTIRRFSSGTTWRRYALNSKSIMMGLERRFAVNTNNRPYYYENP